MTPFFSTPNTLVLKTTHENYSKCSQRNKLFYPQSAQHFEDVNSAWPKFYSEYLLGVSNLVFGPGLSAGSTVKFIFAQYFFEILVLTFQEILQIW